MKRAIVVGASSGIGREVARIFIAKGWKVGLMARREAPLQALKALSPGLVEVAVCDVTHSDSPARLQALITQLGGVDLYFHAAGVGKVNPLLLAEVEESTVMTNALGFMRMIDTAFTYMAEHHGGHIAAISSIAGTKGLGPAPAYSATKAFQNNYIEALEQLAGSRKLNIRFTDIRPGFVDTPLIEGTSYPMEMRPERVAKSIVSAIEQRRHVCIIDWRYRLLVPLWRAVPRCLWRRFNLIGSRR